MEGIILSHVSKEPCGLCPAFMQDFVEEDRGICLFNPHMIVGITTECFTRMYQTERFIEAFKRVVAAFEQGDTCTPWSSAPHTEPH